MIDIQELYEKVRHLPDKQKIGIPYIDYDLAPSIYSKSFTLYPYGMFPPECYKTMEFTVEQIRFLVEDQLNDKII